MGLTSATPQLRWLAERLPHLRELRLAGNSWPAVSALCGCRCPLLTHLDVAWVSGIYDACLRDLVSTPRDHRPGLDASASRFRRCSRLSLAGTDITDESLETVARHLPLLEHIDLSYCVGVGDDGIRILSESSACQTLVSVALTGCVYVTNACFRHLDRFAKLRLVRVEACPEVDENVCIAFGNSRVDCVVQHKEHVRYVK
jgi:F-box/leucine-rich repeat protein 10/11